MSARTRRISAWPAALALCAGAALAQAPQPATPVSVWDAPEPWRTDRFYLQTSLATVHFNEDDEHTNQRYLVDLEWRLSQRWLAGQVLVGGSWFHNSFGQPSQYVYGGLLWRPSETLQPLYLKLTAGVLHGYKGEYQDKIPMNSTGYAPAIAPAVGYCYNRFCSEVVLLGNSGLLWTLGVTLP